MTARDRLVDRQCLVHEFAEQAGRAPRVPDGYRIVETTARAGRLKSVSVLHIPTGCRAMCVGRSYQEAASRAVMTVESFLSLVKLYTDNP